MPALPLSTSDDTSARRAADAMAAALTGTERLDVFARKWSRFFPDDVETDSPEYFAAPFSTFEERRS